MGVFDTICVLALMAVLIFLLILVDGNDDDIHKPRY